MAGREEARAESFASGPLCVLLPPGVDLHTAPCMFSQFGEVPCVEMVPGDQLTTAVVLHDARAAALALGSFGPDFCWPAPCCGSRAVRMPGRDHIDLDDIAGFSRVWSAPAYIMPTDHVARAAARPTEGRGAAQATWAVLVTGLPAMLATEPWFKVVLEQAGLGDLAAAFEVWTGEPCGGAVVLFGQRTAAEYCVHHFEGCQWNAPGELVTATLLSQEEAASELALRGKMLAAASGCTASSGAFAAAAAAQQRLATAAPPPGLPAKVDIGGWAAGSTAEESTDAGPSEAGDDQGWIYEEVAE